jgi:hypothetical protein
VWLSEAHNKKRLTLDLASERRRELLRKLEMRHRRRKLPAGHVGEMGG